MDITSYFKKLRFDDKYHLGLVDIRLTIGQQEEIIKFFEEKLKEAYTDGFSDDKYDFDIENYLTE